jgi:putative pyrroloquinoline-quinone binding quinoprotein
VLCLMSFTLLFGAAELGLAREKKTVQKSATDTQARGGDTYIDVNLSTANFGATDPLSARAKSGNAQNALLLFDLSSLANVGVKAATLNLNVTSYGHNNRTYEAHNVTSLWTELGATWNDRLGTTAWGAAGGDFNATATSSFTLNGQVTPFKMNYDITPDVQGWYTGSANYGTLIKESSTGANDATGITFNSRENATVANRPGLDVTFLQQVSGLTAMAGNATVTLNWTNPTALSGSTVLEGYAGVLILRQHDKPVSATSVPADGTTYSQCNTIGSNNDVVVFVDASNATTFTDNGACGGLTNDHEYFYKVFAVDTVHNYSTVCGTATSGTGACAVNASAVAPEVTAVPSATGPYQAAWVVNTLAAGLAPPGLNPGTSIVTGSNKLVFDINASTGVPVTPPVSIGGTVSGRAALIDGPDSSIGHDVAYIPAQDDFVYGINSATGAFDWIVTPASAPFTASASVQLKAFSAAGYTLAQDLVVVGTHNTSTTNANQIFGLNANTGAVIWTHTGAPGPNTGLDIISSSPMVDYANNAIWVASRSNGGTAQPSLWKLDPNTGTVLFTAKLGPIDYSPTLAPQSDVLFVSVNGGALTAIDPITGSTLGSVNPGDGGVKNSAAVATGTMPYTVVFSSNTQIWAYQFSCATNPCLPAGGTFTKLWGGTAVNNPSAPLTFFGISKVYVGDGQGKIHELDLATGVDSKQRLLNTSVTVGDVGIDVVLNHVLASASDGRSYAFSIPF